MKTTTFLVCIPVLLQFSFDTTASAQELCSRILFQDSTINNLVDPPGYEFSSLGELGRVSKVGNGPQDIIFIPGLGFGGEVVEEYFSDHKELFTAYLITLPGFGGTAAPPAPKQGTSFGEQTWTTAATEAIERLLLSGTVTNPIIMGHWLTGTQIALNLSLRHPEKVKGLIIVSGSACFVGDTTQYPPHPPLERRIAIIDEYMAPTWFKTVTRETWDDNNFLPNDYAVNPIRGLRLWRKAASPDIHVWIRYLCEFFAQDVSLELQKLKVPMLLVKPSLDGNFVEPGNDYMNAYCHLSWEASAPKCEKIKIVTIPDSRVFIWYDQPVKFSEEVKVFLSHLK